MASPVALGLVSEAPFPNAPITEALLDVRARLPKTIDLARLAEFQGAVAADYPTRRERTAFQGGVQFGPGGSASFVETSSHVDGYLFVSRDGRQIVQARLDGFTFNRLRPYQSWTPFRDEARGHWERYRQLATPEMISRVALRYINRIEVPITAKDFKEYILTTPEIAPGLSQGLAGFLMRFVIPLETFGCTAVVTETMEEPKDDKLPLILDIDVFVEKALAPDAEEIWKTFESLHAAKNEVFFKSITPKARELFK